MKLNPFSQNEKKKYYEVYTYKFIIYKFNMKILYYYYDIIVRSLIMIFNYINFKFKIESLGFEFKLIWVRI